jgi:Flp pilus assembly protein TadD
LPDAEKAVSLAPKDANTFGTRAAIFERLGQRDKAISDYRTKLKLVPNDDFAKDGLKRLGAAP